MTHTPEAAPDLVERVAQFTADHCGADSVGEWEREYARAVVALVLDEAAKVGEIESMCEGWCEFGGKGKFEDCQTCRIAAAIRALLPDEATDGR